MLRAGSTETAGLPDYVIQAGFLDETRKEQRTFKILFQFK
jgi:hypothetical protein